MRILQIFLILRVFKLAYKYASLHLSKRLLKLSSTRLQFNLHQLRFEYYSSAVKLLKGVDFVFRKTPRSPIYVIIR